MWMMWMYVYVDMYVNIYTYMYIFMDTYINIYMYIYFSPYFTIP